MRRLIGAVKRNKYAYRTLRPIAISAIRGYYGTKRFVCATVRLPWDVAYERLDRVVPLSNLQLLLDDFRVIRRHWRTPGARGIGRAAAGNTVVMIVISDLRIDPRVEREARALTEAGYLVHVIYPDTFSPAADAPVRIDWGPRVTFEPLSWEAARFTMTFPGILGRDLLAAALLHQPFAFHGHDLVTASAALVAAHVTGAHAVCDFHEWFSENVDWDAAKQQHVPMQGLKKQTLRAVERACLARASAVVTVCGSIARDLEKHFARGRQRVHVIRNIPAMSLSGTRDYRPLKEELGLSPDSFVVLWQGGTGPTRLIEPIIEALAHEPRAILAIRGPSLDLFGDGYRKVAWEAGVEDRLILLPPVPSRDVVVAARGADAGIWSLPALCKNFTYALPNKIFEYLAAGLPVLAAHYPEAHSLVQGNDVGVCFDPYDPTSIAAAITALLDDAERRAAIKKRTAELLVRLNADQEWRKLAAIYDDLRPALSPLARAAAHG